MTRAEKRADHADPAYDLLTPVGFEHQLAGLFRPSPVHRGLEAGGADRLAAGCPFRAHRLERAHAPFVSRPARLDPLAQPGFFLRQPLSNAVCAAASLASASSFRRRYVA